MADPVPPHLQKLTLCQKDAIEKRNKSGWYLYHTEYKGIIPLAFITKNRRGPAVIYPDGSIVEAKYGETTVPYNWDRAARLFSEGEGYRL